MPEIIEAMDEAIETVWKETGHLPHLIRMDAESRDALLAELGASATQRRWLRTMGRTHPMEYRNIAVVLDPNLPPRRIVTERQRP